MYFSRTVYETISLVRPIIVYFVYLQSLGMMTCYKISFAQIDLSSEKNATLESIFLRKNDPTKSFTLHCDPS